MKDPVIGIIGGKGRLGSLFASFFKERGIKVLISDLKTKLSNQELAQKADITIVSVPIGHTPKVIEQILPHLNKNSAIMDFTSVKKDALTAMLKGKCEVLCLHPMFGPSNAIPGQTIIACPTKKSGPYCKWIQKFFQDHGVRILTMTAKQHDKVMNVAQGLVHFADIAFADGLRRMKMPIQEVLDYTSKASELKIQLAARLIAQDPDLYGNIQIANPNTLKSLKEYKKAVDELIKIVQKKDLAAYKKYFKKNQQFLKKYTDQAYYDSSYLIDKHLERKRSESRSTKTQKPSKTALAVLGPINTFSDLAATEYTPKAKKYFTTEIEEIFELVEKGQVKEGIAPIENKLHGTVRETLDSLFTKKVHITDEVTIPINHCLIALSHSKPQDIKTVISHTQALNQCKKYLKKHHSKAAKQAYSSTGAAIEKLLNSHNKNLAVIAPEIAANHSNLQVLAKNIQDERNNTTTFIIIKKGKTPTNPTNTHNKTSIAFHFSKDSAGSLFSVFQDFANAKINMTKIESRPTKAKYGDYIFYLDFDGHISDKTVQKTLKSVEKKVAKLKILGSY